MQTTSKKAHTKEVATEDSQGTEESSLKEEVDEFIDEVDQLLEDQEALVRFRQRGGQ